MTYHSMYEEVNKKVRTDYSKEWNELRGILSHYDKVLAFRFITPILLEQNKEYWDSGHLPYAINVATPKNHDYLIKKQVAYRKNIQKMVFEGYFEALFLRMYKRNTCGIEGLRFKNSDLIKHGYRPIYQKRLHGTLYQYNIQGWEKNKK